MKYGIVTLVFLGVITLVNAQDLTGKYFIGGSLGFETTSGNTDVNGTNYYNPNGLGSYFFSPSFGYYFKKNLAVGLQLGHSSNTQNILVYGYPSDSNQIVRAKNSNQVLNIAALLRFTIPILETVGFNINFTIPYSYSRYSEPSDGSNIVGVFSGESDISDNYSSYSFGININPGFQWFINNNIALLGTLGALSYAHYKTNANR
jgi:hypothetical protein